MLSVPPGSGTFATPRCLFSEASTLGRAGSVDCPVTHPPHRYLPPFMGSSLLNCKCVKEVGNCPFLESFISAENLSLLKHSPLLRPGVRAFCLARINLYKNSLQLRMLLR